MSKFELDPIADSELEETEKEHVEAPTPHLATRQLSSTFSNQHKSGTCALHSCTKTVIKFIKTMFKNDFPFLKTEEVFYEDGNPCNIFYEETFFKKKVE
jgi:aminopeptidase C